MGTAGYPERNISCYGYVLIDKFNKLYLSLNSLSYYEGAVNPESDGTDVEVTVNENSTWKLNADSYTYVFVSGNGKIIYGNYHIYLPNRKRH